MKYADYVNRMAKLACMADSGYEFKKASNKLLFEASADADIDLDDMGSLVLLRGKYAKLVQAHLEESCKSRNT